MYQPKALSDIQFSIAAWLGRRHPCTEVVPGSALLAMTRSAKGDGPKTPERLGCRPAGTSLLSLGRTASCQLSEAGHYPEKCVRPEVIERVG
jgi:hypothetical protein